MHAVLLKVIHTAKSHTTDRTVLSCLLWRCELSRLDRQTGAFCVWSVSECVGRRSATAERTCRADSIHIAWHDTALSCSVWRVVWIGHYATSNHGLRGSASPVLTATGFVNGRWQFSTATESTPLDRSPKNLVQVITSAAPTAVPNLVQIRPRGASGQMGEI